jgi:hypothetical protein
MAFGCTVCLLLIWLLRLVAWYMKCLSTVLINVHLVVNSRRVMIVCMGTKEWWECKRCLANLPCMKSQKCSSEVD